MLQIVHSIFMAKNLAISIATYFKIVESVDVKLDKLMSKDYEGAMRLLEQASYISNSNTYYNLLWDAVSKFNSALSLEKRNKKLVSYLGLMLCYYRLGEGDAVRAIQQQVSYEEFGLTFWEEHGGEIKEGAWVVIGGLMSALSGGAVSPGQGAALGGRTGSQQHEGHNNDVRFAKQQFDELKQAILGINFI